MKRLRFQCWAMTCLLVPVLSLVAQEATIVAVKPAEKSATPSSGPPAKFCPTCKHFFPPTERFCRVDGMPLADAQERREQAKVCPRCKESFDGWTKFCPHDGAPLADSPSNAHTPVKNRPAKPATGKESPNPQKTVVPDSASNSRAAVRAGPEPDGADENSPFVGAAYIHALRSAIAAADADKDRLSRKADKLAEPFHSERSRVLASERQSGESSLEAVRRFNQRVNGHFDEGRRRAQEGNQHQAIEEYLKFLFGTPDFDTPQADEANQFIIDALHFSVLDWLWGEPEVAVVESGKPHRRLPLGFRSAAGEARSDELPHTIVCLRDGAEMVFVPGGTELMGNEAGPADERPAHAVSLRSFYIDKLETSVAQYERFLAASGHRVPQLDDANEPTQWEGRTAKKDAAQLPVVHVSWNDARSYAQWSGKSLPSEAQWERAARGSFAADYPRSADPSFLRHVNAGGGQGSGVRGQGSDAKGLLSVYSFPAALNPFGCQNMLGNVAEWCRDWYDPAYYARSSSDEPLGPDTGELRVVRGGSWQTSIEQLNSTRREGMRPTTRRANVGFRCVLSLPVDP